MDLRLRQLRDRGFRIVSVAGQYCRACRNERDVLLKWEDDHWVVV